VIEALTRIRSQASSLALTRREKARPLMDRVMATPRPVYVGAAAVAAAIWGAALMLQIGRHPSPVFASTAEQSSPGSVHLAAPQASVAPAAPASPAAASPAAVVSHEWQASPPDMTSSIGPEEREGQPPASAPAPVAPQHAAPNVAAPAPVPDPIGALLRGKPVEDKEARLVHAAQVALAKLGYAVKIDGAEDGATRRALRHFEHQHGLAATTDISPELVKRLTAAARAGS
jgi:Putative peptidoglycan binding domain